MRKIKSILFLILFASAINSSAQYTINDEFSDPAETTNLTRDLFAVWWDNDFDYTSQADVLLDQMIAYKNLCINDLSLQVPQSTLDGHFINVYIHADGGYYDMYGWGNGVGTDSFGYPYFTQPIFNIADRINIAHETFHIFQHKVNSSGFFYSGDKQWFTEASANWFAQLQNNNETRAFITAEILVRLPHVPLWLGWFNQPNNYPNNWQRDNHQYALGLFLYYLTEEKGVDRTLITDGYYANTTLYPQEYLFQNIGAANFRSYFMDWATLMTNDFDFGFMGQFQKDANLQEWNTYADPDDDNEFTAIFDNTGTAGWYQPKTDVTTTGWSFNTYKLNNTSSVEYIFEIDAEQIGSYGSDSYFDAKVVVQNSVTGNTNYYDVPMDNDWQGSLSIMLTQENVEVFFVIASMPEVFRDTNSQFQKYPYRMKIQNTSLGILTLDKRSPFTAYPNPVKDIVYIDFENIEEQIGVLVFSSEGKKVMDHLYSNKKAVNIDTSSLKQGFYFIQVSTPSGVDTIKLIKE